MYKKSVVIGSRVDAGKVNRVVRTLMKQALKKPVNHYICVANVHSVVTARRSLRFRAVLQQAWCVVSDGMPLVWSLRCQYSWAERIAGPDLMEKLCEEAEKKSISVYFYGGNDKQLPLLKLSFKNRFPSLRVTFDVPPILPNSPPFSQNTVNRIKTSGAGIVFVGLGCPKQEYWMHTHAPHIPAVLIGVGAAFDFIAGTKKRAPQWMQITGLEWLFRLFSEPRRLWKRYLITNTLFIYYFMRHLLSKIIFNKKK